MVVSGVSEEGAERGDHRLRVQLAAGALRRREPGAVPLPARTQLPASAAR